jgi:hypothetical protein
LADIDDFYALDRESAHRRRGANAGALVAEATGDEVLLER